MTSSTVGGTGAIGENKSRPMWFWTEAATAGLIAPATAVAANARVSAPAPPSTLRRLSATAADLAVEHRLSGW